MVPELRVHTSINRCQLYTILHACLEKKFDHHPQRERERERVVMVQSKLDKVFAHSMSVLGDLRDEEIRAIRAHSWYGSGMVLVSQFTSQVRPASLARGYLHFTLI